MLANLIMAACAASPKCKANALGASLMNTVFQLALSARADWALGVLLSREIGGKESAEMKFQEARDLAWAYGWGASAEPSPLFSDVPDLLDAFRAGALTLSLDCDRCSLDSTI